MKFIITIIGIIGTMSLYGQKTTAIPLANKNIIETTQSAIVYAKFIQRLGFSSGGFPQDIRIQNVKTNEIFALRVKPTFQSKKENIVCFEIPKGDYIIHSYWWTQSKWYGGKAYDEPIYKNLDATERFNFSVEENKIYYLGTWNFDKPTVSFKNEKSSFDKVFKAKYKQLKTETAQIEIPK